MSETSGSFAAAEDRWLAGIDSVRDVVRQELVARQLAEQLLYPERRRQPEGLGAESPQPERRLRILDVGCGQGTQAVRLAAAGHDVTGVDPSAELLDVAATAAREQGVELRLLAGRLEELPTDLGAPFDVVCCHGVLMYLPDLDDAVGRLVALVAPGGLLSLLTRNRFGIAMRAGMSGEWQAALDGFEARHYDNRIGVLGVRADEPSEVAAALQRHGAEVTQWYGVRLFTDTWSSDVPVPAGEELAGLIAAEAEAGRRDPYRQLTSLTHTLARLPA